MSLKRTEILLLIFLTPVLCYSQLITVKQDGTGDVATIQEGVDLSQDGDTVLVWPGTYTENVVCNNKNITLASLALTTGDPGYISQTRIDGDFSGSCLKIRDCLTGVTLCGFTMEHGSGSYWGAISGGGIFVYNVAQIQIRNCFIQNNKVTGLGGGIYCNDSELYLSGVTIRSNHAYLRGGGIYNISSTIQFDSIELCNVYLNYAAVGTDFFKLIYTEPVHFMVDTFTVLNPDYYYLYSYQGWGYPGNDITYEINTGKIEQVNEDLYVAPWGENDNSGLNPAEPLKNINFALLKMASDILLPDTIHVANGIYAPSTGEKYPLSLKANVSIKGASRDSTILDGEEEIYLLNGICYADHYQVSDLTIMNGYEYFPYGYGAIDLTHNRYSSFSNLLFKNNYGEISSCGLIINSNNFSLHNCEFSDNTGGVALTIGHANSAATYYDSVRVYNCRFTDNKPAYFDPEHAFGGGLGFIGQTSIPGLITGYVYNSIFDHNHTKFYAKWGGANSLGLLNGSKVNVINCSFGDNTSENPEGANIGITHNSDMNIYNSIMYGNYPAELYMFAWDGDDCSLSLYNSLVLGGEEEIRILSPWNNLYYDPTNIDADPVWDTSAPWPYSILQGSPCIDAGTLALPPDMELPETDYAGNPRVWNDIVDMGAYEYGPWVGAPEVPSSKFKGQSSKLMQISPNPFSYGTYISYEIMEKGLLNISVYNISGMKVRALINSVVSIGDKGSFYWDGSDQQGNDLPAGTYIVRMTLEGELFHSEKVVKY